MRSEKLLLTLGFSLALLLTAGPAKAQNCSISTSSVLFGNYDAYGTFVDSAGNVRVGCLIANVTVDLSRGNAPSFARYMVSGIEHLDYNLYLDAARTTIWGDNTGGSSHFSDFLLFRNVDIPIYGRIPAPQDVKAGVYADSITATVNF
jgi:spore coat protein U-like protein